MQDTKQQEMSTLQESMLKRLLEGGDDEDDSLAAEIIFQIIFYGLFGVMLVTFWFVFKRGQKVNWTIETMKKLDCLLLIT